MFCYVVLCSQALLLSSFSSPCSLSAFALMCSFYFMPKLMSQNENECYIIMCFTRCFANMICNAFLQVFHNMFYCSSVLFNSLELFRICSTVLQSNVFFMSISNVFVLPFFFSEIVWAMDCEMEFRVVRETTGRRSRSWSKNWKKDPFFEEKKREKKEN